MSPDTINPTLVSYIAFFSVSLVTLLVTALAIVLWWVFTRQQKILDGKADKESLHEIQNNFAKEIKRSCEQSQRILEQNDKFTKAIVALQVQTKNTNSRLDRLQRDFVAYIKYMKRRNGDAYGN